MFTILLFLCKGATGHAVIWVQFDVVQHGETNARSTALHAAILAAADVTVYRHASKTSRRCSPLNLLLPEYTAGPVVVLFPEGPHTPVIGHCPPFERVVVLESNWRKARGLLQHPKLAGLPRVQLPPGSGTSQFSWRRGDGSFRGAADEGLSSIEAIVQCCRLLAPNQCFDGLLRYFEHAKRRVEEQGLLPTSRQEARAREQQQQQEVGG
ncbi:hypothetical protein D9Q98_008762 [Chlorella vulgaris]|uniref:tRNA-uridine aminocarboxypropyltransferase 1 n=1 Tax=Chlorella vulgaris TaxID=3077 RepID=A0A9D4YUE4_CHLVU|nr:hypothetical protein D9Q98_008762 [Chlorella vulgaris]